MLSNGLFRSIRAGLIAALVLVPASSCCCLLGGAVTPPMTPFAIEKDLADAMWERVSDVKAKPGPFSITITDHELTSYLVGLARSGAGEFPAQDVKIEFHDGYAEIWATFVDVAPSDLPVYVRATAQAVDGDLVFMITRANAGPIPVPGAMRELIAQSLSETLAELQFNLDVEQVELRSGEMVLSGEIGGEIPDLPRYVVN